MIRHRARASLSTLLLIGLVALLCGRPAAATSITADTLLKGWNLVVLGDLVSSSEVEGRAYIGGNLAGGSANFFIRGNNAPPSDQPALIVGGSITGGAKNLNHGGDAVIGGHLTTYLNMNGGGTRYVEGWVTVKQNGPAKSTVQGDVFIPNLETAAQDLSHDLAALDANSAVTKHGNRATFAASPDSTGTSIFGIEDGAGFFAGIGELGFDLGDASTIVVNVGGFVIDVAENIIGSNRTDIAQTVIWNFYEATAIRFGTEFFGTILAPHAAVTNVNALNGTVIVADFVQNGEVHLPGFSGEIPDTSDDGTIVVPEPGSGLLFAGGLLAAGLFLRRKRS